jgi:sulfur carrier protein ThiS
MLGGDTVRIRYRGKEWELEGHRTIEDAIEAIRHELGLSPDRLLALRDGRVVHDDTLLEEDDEIQLLSVISGG